MASQVCCVKQVLSCFYKWIESPAPNRDLQVRTHRRAISIITRNEYEIISDTPSPRTPRPPEPVVRSQSAPPK